MKQTRWFVAPFLVFMILMVAVPFILLLAESFQADGGFSFENFRLFFTDGITLAVVWRSIWIALLVSSICLVIAYPVAYGLALGGFKRGPVILILFILPMWINLLLRAAALRQLYGMLGIPVVGLLPLVIALVLELLPLVIIPIYLVLTNVSKKYIEASQDLGASPFQTFRKATLPLSLPGIIIGFLFAFIPTVSNYAIASYFGDNNTFMIGQRINFLLSMATPQIGQAAVISIALLLVIFIVLFITDRLSKIGNKRGGVW